MLVGIKEKKEVMPAGRPTVMTKETVQKLEIAFSNGATDEQACFIAGISRTTLHNYQQENPEFINRKEDLKNNLKYIAKSNIADAIRGNEKLEDSKWYLEKKDKDFMNKSAVDHTTGGDKLNISDEDRVLMARYLNKKGKDNG